MIPRRRYRGNPKNNQAVFNFVVTFIRQQGVKSFDADLDTCCYRGPGGSCCAAGCLILDADYKKEWEGLGISPMPDEHGAVKEYFVGRGFDPILLDRLQAAHDGAEDGKRFARSFTAAARRVAKDLKLKMPVLEIR